MKTKRAARGDERAMHVRAFEEINGVLGLPTQSHQLIRDTFRYQLIMGSTITQYKRSCEHWYGSS